MEQAMTNKPIPPIAQDDATGIATDDEIRATEFSLMARLLDKDCGDGAVRLSRILNRLAKAEAAWNARPVEGVAEQQYVRAAIKQARQAMQCLHFGGDSHIAGDVKQKVERAFDALKGQHSTKRTPPQSDVQRSALWQNIARAIETMAKYYKADVGDRIANIHDITDAVLREVNRSTQTGLKPEVVSPMKCAQALLEKHHGRDYFMSGGEQNNYTIDAKTVLDTAGVKYSEGE